MKKDYREYVGQTSTMSLELEVETAYRSFIETPNGKLTDFTSGISVQNLGFGNYAILDAVKLQAERYMHTGVYGEHVQKPQVELAKAISKNFRKRGMNNAQLFYTNSGTESTELALKATRKITQRYDMLAVEGGYHGRTYGAMEVGYRKEYTQGFGVSTNTRFLKRNDFTDLKKVEFSNYAGVILELVQGEAGGYPLEKKWVEQLCYRVWEAGGMVIFDEVQTGFGRTGTLFAQEQYDIVPNFTTLGKAIGGGLPLGGVVAEKRDWEHLETPAFSHVSTQAGNPVCCAAGLALWQQLSQHLLDGVKKKGIDLFQGLRAVQGGEDAIADVRNLGLLGAIEFVSADFAHEFVDEMRTRGYIVGYKLNNPKTVRIAPPLTIAPSEIDNFIATVDRSIKFLKWQTDGENA